jgi:hypothetical protein
MNHRYTDPLMPQTRRYNGIAYRQSRSPDAPYLVSFVATAEELLEWAGIPRRSEENLVGFQRAFDPKRVDRAKEFFDFPENQSPTALVVGLHPLAGRDPDALEVEMEGDITDSIRPCVITVRYSDHDQDLEQIISAVRRQLDYRLSQQTPEADDEDAVDNEDLIGRAIDTTETVNGGENEGTDSLAPSDDDTSDDEDDDNEEIELGRSVLDQLRERLDSPEWCHHNEEALRDMAKPATLIDGQHRVKGAEGCERGIPFAVCAIVNCEWSEQVYQFTVVNYTAKGIPDQFITANAALSLTRDELNGLQNRLVQAGVKVIEYELMKVIQFDSHSPFFGLINLSEKKDPGKIGYKTMVRVARVWYLGRHPVYKQILPNLYPDLTKRATRPRLERWKAEHWGDFFLDFWNVVADHYRGIPSSHRPDGTLWEVGSQLMVAIVLLELQEAFLTNLNAQDEDFFLPRDGENAVEELRTKLKRRAEKFVEWFPPEFFATKWAISSLNTGFGRTALQQALRQFVDTKGRYQYGKSSLLTGKTTD